MSLNFVHFSQTNCSFPDLIQRHVVKAHPGTCICIEFAPSGHYFAVGSADASVSLWDLEDLACVQTYNRLYIITYYSTYFWYNKGVYVIQYLVYHPIFFSNYFLRFHRFFTLCFCPHCINFYIFFYRITTLSFQIFRLDWPVRALSFSYDGKMLASGSEDLYVDISDVTTGEKVRHNFRYLLYYVFLINYFSLR